VALEAEEYSSGGLLPRPGPPAVPPLRHLASVVLPEEVVVGVGVVVVVGVAGCSVKGCV